MSKPTHLVLTERDEKVLVSLFKYGRLTTSQVQRLHFPSPQTAMRRLRTLRNAGYVAATHPLGMFEYVETLTESGAEIVAAYLGVSRADLKWTPPIPSSLANASLRYSLLVNDVRIALTKACSRSSMALLGFLSGVQEAPSDASRTQLVFDVVADIFEPHQKIAHAPDGVFALQGDEPPRLFFLEIDRKLFLDFDGDRGVARILDYYESYWASGGYQRYRDTFRVGVPFDGFRVLLLVANEERRRAVMTRIRGQPCARRIECFTWVGLQGICFAKDVLAATWLPLRPLAREACRLGASLSSPAELRPRGSNRTQRDSP